MTIKIKEFFDEDTSSFCYVAYSTTCKNALIIDPVLIYDQPSTSIDLTMVNEVCAFIEEKDLKPKYILETHVHADHISAASFLKQRFKDIKVGIHQNIHKVKEHFLKVYQLEDFKLKNFFDFNFKQDDLIEAGEISLRVIETPGHTPNCSSFLINDEHLFVGDSIFMPDFGTGRCDFPLGSATDLYNSITQKIYTLADDVKIYVGHDYKPGGRELKFQTTVGEQKEKNIHINNNSTQEQFIEYRTTRDKQLSMPRLLYHAIQFNIKAGAIGESDFFKIPIYKI